MDDFKERAGDPTIFQDDKAMKPGFCFKSRQTKIVLSNAHIFVAPICFL